MADDTILIRDGARTFDASTSSPEGQRELQRVAERMIEKDKQNAVARDYLRLKAEKSGTPSLRKNALAAAFFVAGTIAGAMSTQSCGPDMSAKPGASARTPAP